MAQHRSVLTLIQARMGSKRLPGKSLKPISGRPLIEHVISRACMIQRSAGTVLVTSQNDRDSPLADLAYELCIPCYRGSEWDVLGRFEEALKWVMGVESSITDVIRITGDCPLLCVDVADKVVSAHIDGGYSYTSNDTLKTGYPDGTDVEVFGADVLLSASKHALDRTDREHVTRWMRHKIDERSIGTVDDETIPTSITRQKWSVDTNDDLERVRRIFGCLESPVSELRSVIAAAAKSSEL